MRKIDSLDQNGNKVALLTETKSGWKVFLWRTKQSYGASGWTEKQAKAFVTTYLPDHVKFKEREHA